MGDQDGYASMAWRQLKKTASGLSRKSSDYGRALTGRSSSLVRHSSDASAPFPHNGVKLENGVSNGIPEEHSAHNAAAEEYQEGAFAVVSTAHRAKFLEAYDAATLELMRRTSAASEAKCVADAAVLKMAPWNHKPGFLGHLTSHQEEALKQMRSFFPDSRRWHTDHDILRFLRARDFDVSATKDMYTKYIKEYRGQLMNTPNPPIRPVIGHLDSEKVLGFYPLRDAKLSENMRKLMDWFLHTSVFGSDKDGRPVVYFRPADIIKQSMMKYVPCADRIAFQSAANEATLVLLKLASQRAGYHIDNITQVLDLSGMSALQMVSHMRSPDAQREWQHNMDFVPEILHKVYVINAPSGMSMVWKVACLFMPAATTRKVTVCGYSYKAELAAAIGLENMPSCYGGKKPFEWPKHRPVKELKY